MWNDHDYVRMSRDAQEYKAAMEEQDRSEEIERHAREIGEGKSIGWPWRVLEELVPLWPGLAVLLVVAVLFIIF